MRSQRQSVMREASWKTMVAGLLVACVASGPLAPIGLAEEGNKTSAEVRAEAARESERLDALVAQLENGRAEIDGLDTQLKELSSQSLVVQKELIEDRDSLSRMVSETYRFGGDPTLIGLVLASKDLEDLVSNIYYVQKVTEWQTECVDALKDDKRELEEHMTRIEGVREDRTKAVESLEQSCAEVSQVVDELYAQAESLEEKERAAEQERLAKIAKQVQEENERLEQERQRQQAQQQAQTQTLQQEKVYYESTQPGGQSVSTQESGGEGKADVTTQQQYELSEQIEQQVGTGLEQGAQNEQQVSTEQPQQVDQPQQVEQPSQPEQPIEQQVPQEVATQPEQPAQVEQPAAQEPAPTDGLGGGWVTCRASAYTIEDNTPPGSTATASGIPLDHSIPTVAMAASLNPAQFYGSSIQIEYGGMTVIATVTDCGSLGGGYTSLDLTPAVFQAFGASTADDWGIREVRYRFL